MAIEYKKAITFTKESTLYGHNTLDEGGFPSDAGNGKVQQILDLSQEQTVDNLKASITITVDSSNTLLYHFNIDGESVATFTVPSDRFLKSVSYDTSTQELVFTFVTSEGENTVRVDMSALVDTYTAGSGLALSNNVFSIKIKSTEARLSANADGLALDLSDIISLIDTERTQRQNTYSDLDARIVVIENKFADIDNAVATCNTKASEASASAAQASGSATSASEKASAAASSASLASTYAANANTYKTEAETAKSDAQTYASNAEASADNASKSEANAKTSETNASTKATEAEASKNLARLWAISESIVESEDYSAKYYASKAEEFSKMLCYFRKQTYAVSASAGDTAITIPTEAQYRSGADILFVHNKGVYLKEGTDYTKTDTGIVLANALEVATTIEIDILRAVSTDSQSYDLLKGDKGDKGTSITSVEQTSTSTEDDGQNIVTVTLSDDTSSTFTVKNGSKGSKGDKGDKGATYTASELLDLIYPVGAIYTSLEAASPAGTLGGTWTQIKDTFLYAQGSKSVGATGGEESHMLTEREVPSHSHTRGSMNITGSFYPRPHYNGMDLGGAIPGADGSLFSLTNHGGGGVDTAMSEYNAKSNQSRDKITFDASKAWTGSTSSYGGDGSHNNMPPYLVVYMWRRTA